MQLLRTLPYSFCLYFFFRLPSARTSAACLQKFIHVRGMFNRVLTGVQLKPWLYSKYFVQYYPVRSLYSNLLKYSKKGDEPTEELPSSDVPKDFQKELFLDTYCPPLAQPRPRVHPIKKSLDVLKITGRNDPKTYNNMYFPRHCDIVIIGGGIMGCSIAYWLKQKGHDNGLRVIVVERDPSYTRVLFNYYLFCIH